MSEVEAERKAVAPFRPATPKGAKPDINRPVTLDDVAEQNSQHPVIGEITKRGPGRPPTSDTAEAFARFGRILMEFKQVDKATQKHMLTVLTELLT